MPFLVPKAESAPSTIFYIIRSATSHIDTSVLSQNKAFQLAQQGKNVLLFDALLGLKNISVSNKNSKKIYDFFKGQLPLTELIIRHKNVDIIAGVSTQNLNACSPLQQNKVKQDLLQLSQCYDYVLVDLPYNIISSTFEDIGENYWGISFDKKIILDTLKVANTSSDYFVLSEPINEKQLNEFFLFFKTLAPEGCLETHFL